MSVSRARSRLAVQAEAAKYHPSAESAERVLDSDRAFAAANLQAYIGRIVESAPVLTRDQLQRLSMLLHGSQASR